MADDLEVPRRTIIDRVTARLADQERLFLLVGAPGAGKTVAARQVAAACADKVVLTHHGRMTDERSLNPADFLAALSDALARTVPGFAEARKRRILVRTGQLERAA